MGKSRKYTFPRREFLQKSLHWTGGLALMSTPSCAIFDRYFLAEKMKLDEEVLIIGAGAAGLAAAYELKRKKIPYRVYEASSRVGGRVQTLSQFNSEQQFAELGGEFFERKHKIILDLCKELNLPVDEIQFQPRLENQVVMTRGKIYLSKELKAKYQKFNIDLIKARLSITGDDDTPISSLSRQKFPLAIKWDAVSVKDFLLTYDGKIDKDLLNVLMVSAACQFGKSPDQVSCLQFLNSLDLESQSENFEDSTLFRVRGGNEKIFNVLHERIAGVLPNHLIHLKSRLLKIQDRDDFFQCTFETPDGEQNILARFVIFAIPANQYQHIEGFEALNISMEKRAAISKMQLGEHSKLVLSFKEKLWHYSHDRLPAYRGRLVIEPLKALLWDSSVAQEGKSGLLSSLQVGPSGPLLSEELILYLSTYYGNIRSQKDAVEAYINWAQKPFIQGSHVVYGPGEFLKNHGVWSYSEYGGRMQFAGEHCHLKQYGSMFGALQTGIEAAQSIAPLVPVPVREAVF